MGFLATALIVAGLSGLAMPQEADAAGEHEVTALLPLSVLYLGSLEEPRGAAYEEFLSGAFANVEAIERDSFSPEEAAGFDVVLLDWSQSEETGFLAGDVHSPLGPRDDWTTPTVFLASAGLWMAAAWECQGAYG